MISIYQSNFFSYTNHITYIVMPYHQQNSIIVQNGLDYENMADINAKLNHSTCLQEHSHIKDDISRETQRQIINNEKDSQKNIQVAVEQKLQKKPKKNTQRKQHLQKYGRNICSNIFHIIIKKILYEKQYNDVILKIIQSYGMSITLDQFYNKLYFKQNKLNEYVPFDKIIEFYLGHKNKIKEGMKRHNQFCRILRIISKLYLQKEHIAIAFDCQKLKRESKCFHIKESRKLYSIIRGTYKQDYKA